MVRQPRRHRRGALPSKPVLAERWAEVRLIPNRHAASLVSLDDLLPAQVFEISMHALVMLRGSTCRKTL
jgi:hypothetical protein